MPSIPFRIRFAIRIDVWVFMKINTAQGPVHQPPPLLCCVRSVWRSAPLRPRRRFCCREVAGGRGVPARSVVSDPPSPAISCPPPISPPPNPPPPPPHSGLSAHDSRGGTPNPLSPLFRRRIPLPTRFLPHPLKPRARCKASARRPPSGWAPPPPPPPSAESRPRHSAGSGPHQAGRPAGRVGPRRLGLRQAALWAGHADSAGWWG